MLCYNVFERSDIMKKLVIGLFTIVLCLFLVSCSKVEGNKEIVGTWVNDTTLEGYEFIYTFLEDGTGTYDVAGTIMNFKYTIKGDRISFEFTDEDMETLDTTFEIKDDVLNVRDSNGEDVLYEKVKLS